MKGTFPIHKFRELRTPFYYYDTKVLRDTLSCIRTEAARYGNYSVHYAVKANANPKVLAIIRENGLGADCVSGGEIRAAIKAGFPTGKIVFAGVGKADWEINLGLDYDIFCFNVESVPELEIINELAAAKGKVANVAFRINPNVGAHTHANITTGLAENKFGISILRDLQQPSETPSPPDAPLRAGTCGSGTMRFIDFAGALCEAGHQQAVCHSGCRHDGFDSSGTLPSVP